MRNLTSEWQLRFVISVHGAEDETIILVLHVRLSDVWQSGTVPLVWERGLAFCGMNLHMLD